MTPTYYRARMDLFFMFIRIRTIARINAYMI